MYRNKNQLIINKKVNKISGSKVNFQKSAVFLSTSEYSEKYVSESSHLQSEDVLTLTMEMVL